MRKTIFDIQLYKSRVCCRVKCRRKDQCTQSIAVQSQWWPTTTNFYIHIHISLNKLSFVSTANEVRLVIAWERLQWTVILALITGQRKQLNNIVVHKLDTNQETGRRTERRSLCFDFPSNQYNARQLHKQMPLLWANWQKSDQYWKVAFYRWQTLTRVNQRQFESKG